MGHCLLLKAVHATVNGPSCWSVSYLAQLKLHVHPRQVNCLDALTVTPGRLAPCTEATHSLRSHKNSRNDTPSPVEEKLTCTDRPGSVPLPSYF